MIHITQLPIRELVSLPKLAATNPRPNPFLLKAGGKPTKAKIGSHVSGAFLSDLACGLCMKRLVIDG